MNRLRRFVLRLKPPCGRSVRVFVALMALAKVREMVEKGR